MAALSRLRRAGRDAVVAMLSLSVVGAALLYVFGTPRPTGTVTVRDEGIVTTASGLSTGVPAAVILKPRQNPCIGADREVLYGKVTASSGVVVRKTTFTVTTASRYSCGSVVVPKTGIYRSVLNLRPGRYELTITVRTASDTVTDTRALQIRDNHVYQASVSVGSGGVFSFLPISSY